MRLLPPYGFIETLWGSKSAPHPAIACFNRGGIHRCAATPALQDSALRHAGEAALSVDQAPRPFPSSEAFFKSESESTRMSGSVVSVPGAK